MNEETLTGYILEELLASLIQSAGYRLLTDRAQDPDELRTARNGDLLVRGRGGNHQVDVLGEFVFVPAFSQPVRLFVEAKARRSTTGLPTVRNALGTIIDVNEAWMLDYSKNRTRRHYRYALFSTSGFTAPAQNYAIAHQISLVDLSGPEWTDLTEVAHNGASDLLARAQLGDRSFPVNRLREILRNRLGTAPPGSPTRGEAPIDVLDDLQTEADLLAQRFLETVAGALLVFPASGQVQLARPESLGEFIARVTHEPEHQVTLSVDRRQVHGRARTWIVRPLHHSDASYSLRLTLPAAIERRALAESDRLQQVLRAKDELGGRLDVFWDPRGREAGLLQGPRLFRLLFAGVDLRRRRPDNLAL
jgi:Restriction endonuclease